MKCPYCYRRMSSWRLQCRVCRRNVWRAPYLIFFGFLALAAFAGLIYVIEILAQRG